MFLANNLTEFKQNFIQQLHVMLQGDSLGAFILVLANSMQDEVLYASLQEPITKRFKELSAHTPAAPDDDQQVFDEIKKSGIDKLTCWKSYPLDGWEFIYNPLRAMRPARASQEIIKGIQQPFDRKKFNFNKPFLKSEILWEGRWLGKGVNKEQAKQYRVLYNKFPFAPWHLLIVPEPEKEQSQYLTKEAHEDIFALSEQCQHLQGFGVGYNSLGANASINQLHFQGFMKDSPLLIESSIWHHNGGDQLYPVNVSRYQKSATAWQKIELLHHLDKPYTLLYRNGYCYVIARVKQGQVALPSWAEGIGWHEICGVFTLADESLVTHLSADDIYTTLARLSV